MICSLHLSPIATANKSLKKKTQQPQSSTLTLELFCVSREILQPFFPQSSWPMLSSFNILCELWLWHIFVNIWGYKTLLCPLNLLGWHLIKLHRFQGCYSRIQHLKYSIVCLSPKAKSSSIIIYLTPFTLTLLPSGHHHTVVCVYEGFTVGQ